jgi:hypothetical protein
MGTKKFDTIIRSKLKGIEVPGQPTDWEAFQKKMEAASAVPSVPGLGQQSDQLISQKLQKVPVHGSASSTWPLLEQKIQFRAILRERVFFYKSLELCLILFFTMLVWQWANGPVLPSTVFESPVQPTAAGQYRPPYDCVDADPVAPVPADESQPGEAARPLAISASVRGVEATPPSFPSGGLSLNDPTPTISAGDVLVKIPDALPTQTAGQALTLAYALPEKSWEQKRSDPSHWAVPAIAVPHFRLPSLGPEEYEEGVFTLKDLPKKARLNVSMLGSADYNEVMTPPNYLYRIKGSDRYALGYGGGLLFGLEYGRMEIGSGLVYAAKQYRPLPVIFIRGNFQDGYMGESLQTVELNMINLPLYLRYDVLRKDKWRAYFSGGASLQVAFEANYYFAPPTAFPSFLAQTPAGESRLRNRIEGWFQGGPFKENSYVTANMAVGVERFVSERWGVFFQPTYHRSFGYFSNGLGPNLDRIHTFSIWTGIRVRVLD